MKITKLIFALLRELFRNGNMRVVIECDLGDGGYMEGEINDIYPAYDDGKLKLILSE